MQLDILATGILFKNQMPHVKSIHAYFPSVAVMPNGSLIAMYVLGEAFEAVNQNVYLSRSDDGGNTWQHQGRVEIDHPDTPTSTFGRIAVTSEGELIANLTRFNRDTYPDQGLSNPDTLGIAPAEMLLIRSSDGTDQ